MGIASCRVDGNDAVACLMAAREARKYIVEERKPFFI
jgi:TPP-dependent pyruvate/acetoin dehydrogenase alpha subunit